MAMSSVATTYHYSGTSSHAGLIPQYTIAVMMIGIIQINNTDFKCLFLGKFKDTGKKFTMKIN